jgi:hypothetical protein
MGDRAGASDSAPSWWPREELRLRVGTAGLAGRPAPQSPAPIAADNSYIVVSPRGTLRKAFRTPSAELGALGEQKVE